MARSGIIITMNTLGPALATAPARFHSALAALMEFQAPRVQGYAQTNAPWQDQTGNARQGLTARAGSNEEEHFIDLFHTMPYGIYLETRWSGRYQIIAPTIQKKGRETMELARDILSKL